MMEAEKHQHTEDNFLRSYIKECSSKRVAIHKLSSIITDDDLLAKTRVRISQIWDDEIAPTEKGKTGVQVDKIMGILGIGSK